MRFPHQAKSIAMKKKKRKERERQKIKNEVKSGYHHKLNARRCDKQKQQLFGVWFNVFYLKQVDACSPPCNQPLRTKNILS